MNTIKVNLYDCLKTMVGMSTNVVVVKFPSREVLLYHSNEYNVEDDVPCKYWKYEVQCLAVDKDKFENSLIIYVNEYNNNCKSYICKE